MTRHARGDSGVLKRKRRSLMTKSGSWKTKSGEGRQKVEKEDRDLRGAGGGEGGCDTVCLDLSRLEVLLGRTSQPGQRTLSVFWV
jgi:hypothetical protein